ncbi:HNH endonuclease [Dermabacter hominis]|uniref:HNH endonuclease n=1 Tax=Dermabacter hominis TaxID=36740 RepID=UPI00223B7368|nr:HNH endonuclease signature motif containing protein [Dermabacter hominis]MCT2026177.1 HNH endonuclease [Dermabacter hominis]
MSAPTLDHTATAVDAISMDGATAAAVGAARSTGIVSPTTDSPNALPISRELVDSGAPTRTDVLNVLLSRSEGWQASLAGMLEAFPTAPATSSSGVSRGETMAHPVTTPARVLDGQDLLTRLDVLESLTRIAELTEAVKAHILCELDETDGIGHLNGKEIAASTADVSSRVNSDESPTTPNNTESVQEPSPATVGTENVDAAGLDPSDGLDSLSDKDRARVFAARRALAHEVSLILKQSPYATSVEIARARMLTKNLPMLLANLEAGRISINETHAITTSLRDATSTHAQQLDHPIARELERSPHAGKTHWRAFTSSALLSLDPATALEREKKAFTKRRLTLKTLRNGMSSLTLTMRTLDAKRIHDLLNHHAARAHAILHQHEVTTAKKEADNHAQHTTTKLHSLLANGDFDLSHLTNTPHAPETTTRFNHQHGTTLNRATRPTSLAQFEREEVDNAARSKAKDFLTKLEQEKLRLTITNNSDGSPEVSVVARSGAWRRHYQPPAHTTNNLAIDTLVETLLNIRPDHPATYFAPPTKAPGVTLDPWTPLPHPHNNNENRETNKADPPPNTPQTKEATHNTETKTGATQGTSLGVRGSSRARRFEIGLLVPVNPDVSSGYIPEAGPITAKTGFDYLNELFDNDVLVKYKRIFTSATTGEVLAMDSRSRFFPKALAELVRLRDRTCRGPYCDAPITTIDHIHRHAQGGPTAIENAQGLCTRCNLAKEALTVTHTNRNPHHSDTTNTTHPDTTTTTWTTPTGRTYTGTTPRYDS